MKQWLTNFLNWFNQWEHGSEDLAPVPTPVVNVPTAVTTASSITNVIVKTMEENVYTQAKLSLGKHMTLDNAVPAEKGCAEAVSAVLALAGISDGSQGIAGTSALYTWLTTHFTPITAPEQGCIIISPTGMGNGSVEGHVGCVGGFNVAFPNDFGIMSNDSASGKFLETWSLARWHAYYGGVGNLPVLFFRPV